MNAKQVEEIYPQSNYQTTGPTRTLPSSEERIQVYRSRAAANRPVFVEGDLDEDARRAIPGQQHARNGKAPRLPRNEGERQQEPRRVTAVTVLHFSARLRLLRKESGYSQAGLARRAGVHLDTIRYYEYGLREPSFATLKLLACALGVNVEEFFGFIPPDLNETHKEQQAQEKKKTRRRRKQAAKRFARAC